MEEPLREVILRHKDKLTTHEDNLDHHWQVINALLNLIGISEGDLLENYSAGPTAKVKR